MSETKLKLTAKAEEANVRVEKVNDAVRRIADFKFKISGYPSGKEYAPLHEIDASLQEDILLCSTAIEKTEVSFPMRKDDGDPFRIVIEPGVTVVYGASGSGKTLLVNSLYNDLSEALGAEKVEMMKFHEPERFVYTSVKSLIDRISAFFASDTEILFVDSFRFFLYNSDNKAAAMSGGISASFFTELTNLHIIANALNKKLIIVANFLSENERNEDVIKNAISGSTYGYFRMFKTGGSLVAEFASRNETVNRNSVFLIVKDFANAENESSSKDTNTKSGKEIQLKVQKEDENFLSAFKRLLNKNKDF